ncbi:MAG: class I SAM-dependent methyltransferase [Paludibacter sp.]|nr:class I SAM-dependent methyltransferase [Paludibacter sp.]
MKNKSFKIRNILSLAWIYQLYQDLVGATNYDKLLSSDYIKYKSGQKILDIGCGPSDILNCLPASVDYVGIDLSQKYIDKAKIDFPNQTFYCSDFSNDLNEIASESFDLVISVGVLHHLTDDLALQLHEYAFRKLKPNGRLITLDGVYTKSQSKLELFFLRNDRGKFVRTEREYLKFPPVYFKNTKHFLLKNVMRIPYTLIIMESVKE